MFVSKSLCMYEGLCVKGSLCKSVCEKTAKVSVMFCLSDNFHILTIYIFTSSHLHLITSSHLSMLTSASLHITHLHIFTSSQLYILINIFVFAPYTCTSFLFEASSFYRDIFIYFSLSYTSRYTSLHSWAIRRLVSN